MIEIKRNITISLLAAAVLTARASLDAQAADSALVATSRYRLRLIGVYDNRTGEPIEGADISDITNGNTIKTSSTGTASLAFLPDGGSLIRIRKLGYEVTTLLVAISPSDTLPLTVVLNRVVELKAMSVIDSAPRYRSPSLRGFEERRRISAAGQFIPEAIIRKEEDRHFGNFLRAHLPTAIIVEGTAGAVYMGRSPRCGAGGAPAIYLDGAYLGAGINLAEFPLTTLAAIEYYPSSGTAPAQFAPTSKSCGSLLLWSRER